MLPSTTNVTTLKSTDTIGLTTSDAAAASSRVSVFNVHHCNVATAIPIAATTSFRPDLDQALQLRIIARARMLNLQAVIGRDVSHNSLHEGKQAGSVESYETVAKWSVLAMVTESARYHRLLTSQTGKRRFFTAPPVSVAAPAIRVKSLAFGSKSMTRLLLQDIHKAFVYHQAAAEAAAGGIKPRNLRRPQSTTADDNAESNASSAVTKVKGIDNATAICRKKLASLELWAETPSTKMK